MHLNQLKENDNEDARQVLEGKMFVNSELLMGFERR